MIVGFFVIPISYVVAKNQKYHLNSHASNDTFKKVNLRKQIASVRTSHAHTHDNFVDF